jgi:opacity protein-like surface antigen
MKKLYLIFILIFITFNICYSQSKVGASAAPFLGISVGPRAIGMGSAFVAVANDLSAIYWNPSGIARTMKTQFLASHTKWLVNTNFNWVGFSLNLNDIDAIGLSFTQLDYGEDNVTTVLSPEGTGEKWDAMDITFGVSYARNLTDRFSIGGTVKYIQQKIWNESASAFALDVGLLYITEFNDLKIGMSISNFGTDMTLDGKDLTKRIDLDPESNGINKTIPAKLKVDPWTLPLFFRVGVAMYLYKTEEMSFTAAIDAFRPSDNNSSVNIGGEFAWNNMVFIRGGYKSLFLDKSEEGLNLGGGLQYNFSGTSFVNVDYAFTSFGKFSNLHTFAIGVTF